MPIIREKITGMDKMIASAAPDLYVPPLRELLERVSITIENRARTNAPVDTGRLRSSLAHEIDAAPIPLYAQVGSNVEYAPMVEYGTGLLSDAPDSKHSRYFPPWGARNPGLDSLARHHGFANSFVVALAIWKRGGTKPTRFLRNAFADSQADIGAELEALGKKIGERWGAGTA